jgi:hypothetical protein
MKFVETEASGFKIFFDPAKREESETKEAIRILSAKFEEISRIVNPKQLQSLRRVPVWIEFLKKNDGAMWYHPNRDWLISNGYSEELTKSVEIKNLRNFLDWQGDQPYMVLHELAHGYQDQFMPHLRQKLESAFKNAVASGKYESVGYINGGKLKAYALTTIEEYFAELTEAYFGKNDYYPFTKNDLREFDPEGYKLMQEAWDR